MGNKKDGEVHNRTPSLSAKYVACRNATFYAGFAKRERTRWAKKKNDTVRPAKPITVFGENRKVKSIAKSSNREERGAGDILRTAITNFILRRCDLVEKAFIVFPRDNMT